VRPPGREKTAPAVIKMPDPAPAPPVPPVMSALSEDEWRLRRDVERQEASRTQLMRGAAECQQASLSLLLGMGRGRGGLQPRGVLRDPKSIETFSLGERLDLRSKHQVLISRLGQGDVLMRTGEMAIRDPVTGAVKTSPTQLMGELTVATGHEVALIRIGNKRYLRLGFADECGHGVRIADADRAIAHTHPSGDLRFSVGPDSDMAVFTNPLFNLTKQKSSVLVAPNGAAVRLPIPR
jgi:hypothetical protein